MRIILRVAGQLLLLAFLYWLGNWPHDQISEQIGHVFPTTRTHWLVWPVLLLQAYTIEAVTCLPCAWLLALIYKRAAGVVALILAAPFAWRALMYELAFAPHPPFGVALIAFHLFSHLAFLCGGAVLLSQPKGRNAVRLAEIAPT